MEGKVLVISDLHLTSRFNERKFNLLKKVINSCDHVIINGDLYDDYVGHKKFFDSEWKKLFPLLKKKKAISILGNHDKDLVDSDFKLFCDLLLKEFEFKQNNTKFFITHGDKRKKIFSITPNFIKAAVSGTAKLGCELVGRSSLAFYQVQNNKLKNWKKKNLNKNTWLITGHTHFAELDNENKYANSGLFLSDKIASYLIIENGKVELVYINK